MSAAPASSASDARLRHLFDPRGVIIVGASSHPAKFGFVALHNVLAQRFAGKVFAVNRDGGEILGLTTATDVCEIPAGEADLALVCTPAAANPDVLRACAAKGVKAVYVVSGGYRETGPDGRRAEEELVALADKLDIVLAGPNGQGLVSTPAGLCAQIVGPYPVTGAISIASQSGNTTSSFMNYANHSGVGIARAVSAGNAAAVTVADYLRWFRDDPATRVGFAYLEHSADGRAVFEGLRAVTREKPVVMVKGGVTAVGQRAAASHTGALAGEQRIFTGAMHQAGVCLVPTVEEAFDAAATFATQPLPKGPGTVVVTTAGGWGVMTADALAASSLRLMPLPDDLRAAIDAKLPPRWSRANPIDMAGGESRDTVPEVLELVASHPAVDAVIFLGLGIQSNSARLVRDGRFYPDHGLERIVAFHERQDRRFAEAAAEASAASAKPVLVATELGVTDPANPGPAAVRATGRYCYPSATRAVTALEHLWHYARFRQRRGW
ncbi:MAG TPA: CoA-binding protein [Acidimicrobiia bacterium]|nr:CoA-binding protein [Acidimicrobiia bacterium]